MNTHGPTASLGALAGGLGVVAGAFGAHGLKAILSPEGLAWWQTGALYHLVHALALLAVGLAAHAALATRPRALRVAAWAFGVGLVLFSGSLYVMALTEVRALGAVTPFGGTAFIVGWAALAAALWPRRRDA